MSIFKAPLVLLIVITLVVAGCSGGISAVSPESQPSPYSTTTTTQSSHSPLGFFTFLCDPLNDTVDVIALRDTEMHLNALKFLEPPVLVYLTLESPPQFNGNILDVDIGLRNPYIGLDQFTGFDVCGIVITHGSLTGFSDPDIVMAGEGDTRLLNADGYTRWWNPAEFPHGNTIFNYIDGMLGTLSNNADFNCTINGYKYFADGLGPDDPLTSLDITDRGMFSTGMKNVRHYTIDMSGGLIFNYAVDANWKKPATIPPETIPDDFPPGTNRPEAWNVSVTEIESYLYFDENTKCAGGYLKLLIDVWDHYNAGLNQISVESPAGIPPTSAGVPIGGGEGYSTYVVDITGENLTRNGWIDLLISAGSEASGYGGVLPDASVCAYFTHSVPVKRGWAQTWPVSYMLSFGKSDDVAVDDHGNIYITGIFNYTVDFDPGPDTDLRTTTVPHDPDIFLCKLDDCGHYQWVSTWAGALDGEYTMYNVATDSAGNVYVSGTYFGTVDFDPGPGNEEHTSSGYDIFLIKFSSEGDFQWVTCFTLLQRNEASGLSVDAMDNLFIIGRSSAAWGLPEYFVLHLAKVSSQGVLQWAVTWDGTHALGVASGDSGSVYVTGYFVGSVDFDPGPGEDIRTAESGSMDTFLSKFDSDGNFIWVQTWDAPDDYIGYMYCFEFLCVDDSGYIYVTGRFKHSLDFDPGPGTDIRASNGGYDIYITKFSPGGERQWTQTWGGEGHDNVEGIATRNDVICVTGSFKQSVDFDPGPGVDTHYAEDGYLFLSKFNLQGDYCWTRNWYAACPNSVDIAETGNIYITGILPKRGDLDPGPGTQYHGGWPGIPYNNDWFVAFLSKFPPDGNW